MATKPTDLIFLSCQPVDKYFLWQVEVQITNFRKFGVSGKMHIVVWYPEWRAPELEAWRALQDKYPETRFFFYPDSGVDLGLYISQLRPHTLKKHFAAIPELKNEVIFYHDSDIIFNYLPDFEQLIHDNVNWQSDCSSYLDYDYLSRKEKAGNIPEDEAVQVMADIGRIPIDIIKSYTKKTGGAQCILKGVDSAFWEDVERQCIEIRKAFFWNIPDSINRKYFPNESAGFQSWCADMWALNMALWNRGKITDVTPLLDFSWATNDYETFLKKPIYHNAGATAQTPHLFFKGNWIHKSPFGQNIYAKKGTASAEYVKAIQEVK